MTRALICCLVLLSFSRPAFAGDAPACFGPDTVAEMGEDSMNRWLSKTGAEELKRRLEKVAGKGRWEGDTYIMPCGVQSAPVDMPALTVESAGPGVKQAVEGSPYFSQMAASSGHTQQEADVLAGKYAQLAGTHFRYLRDEQDRQLNEADLILRRHEKRLGIEDPKAPSDGEMKLDRAKLKALREQIKAAKKRGDTAEVMRLAGEAQQAAAPAVAQAMKVTQQTHRQAWDLMESAFPELLAASYRTRIVLHTCPCVRCKLPQ